MSTLYLTDPSEANPYAQSAPLARPSTPAPTGPATEKFDPFGKDGFSFGSLLDVVNPLQHIPILSSFYRRWTGDEIGMVPRLMGGALFGGFAGFVASLANAVIEQLSGKDIGEHVASLILGDPPTTAVARNETSVEGLPWLADKARPGETAIAGLPWLEVAGRAGPALAGPPQSLTPRSLTAGARPTEVSSLPTPFAAIGESSVDPFVATRLNASDRPRSRDRAEAPLGATANAGGWFSDVMLTALDRYQATARLAEPGKERRVDLTN